MRDANALLTEEHPTHADSFEEIATEIGWVAIDNQRYASAMERIEIRTFCQLLEGGYGLVCWCSG